MIDVDIRINTKIRFHDFKSQQAPPSDFPKRRKQYQHQQNMKHQHSIQTFAPPPPHRLLFIPGPQIFHQNRSSRV